MTQRNNNEKQAVIVVGVIAVLVMIGLLMGFTIWDRSKVTSELPRTPIATVTRPSSTIEGTGNRRDTKASRKPMPKKDIGTLLRVAKPINNPGSWVGSDDYPSRALQQEREGTSAFRLSISASGQPLSCVIISSSGHADLDQATCDAVMRNARFNTALDAAGKPVESSYVSRVRWQIPQ